MRIFAVAAALSIAMAGTPAAGTSPPDLPANLRRLAATAAGLPPEFQADTLLQIVESRGGLDAAVKKDLVERAFGAGQQARVEYPQVAVHRINPDSRQAFLAGALSLKLDRLSLETRAVRMMMAADASAARQMFTGIQKPIVAPGSCADALIPQLDDYYDTAAPVILHGFTAEEISRQEPTALLMRILSGVAAPYEIAPAARLILSVNLTSVQFEAALNALTLRLESIAPEDRSFGETAAAVQDAVAALAVHAGSGPSRIVLARAYRKYLTANYGKSKCSDMAGGRIGGDASISPVDWFNESELRSGLPAIEVKEITAAAGSAGGSPMHLDGFWTTPDSEKILSAARELRTAPNGMSWSAEQRTSSEWNQKLQDFLSQVGQWKQSGDESELDFFNEKAIVYQSLVDVCPAGDARKRLIAAFVDFLGGSDAAARNPVDWFWHAQNLYRRLGQAGDGDAANLMAAYKGSGNLILAVYAELYGR
ncbi:MAG TPA: hypothetical protein VGL53_03035 [Bryobacteraceae bacterium]|jgi:hypothetical protein